MDETGSLEEKPKGDSQKTWIVPFNIPESPLALNGQCAHWNTPKGEREHLAKSWMEKTAAE
jgi:hypothetical protein